MAASYAPGEPELENVRMLEHEPTGDDQTGQAPVEGEHPRHHRN